MWPDDPDRGDRLVIFRQLHLETPVLLEREPLPVGPVSSVATGLVRELGSTQSQAVGRMEEATGKHLQSLKHAHQDQSERLLKLMAVSGKWNRAVLVVLIVVLGGIATLFALQLFV